MRNTPSILSMSSSKLVSVLAPPAGGTVRSRSVLMLGSQPYGATIHSQSPPSAARACGARLQIHNTAVSPAIFNARFRRTLIATDRFVFLLFMERTPISKDRSQCRTLLPQAVAQAQRTPTLFTGLPRFAGED